MKEFILLLAIFLFSFYTQFLYNKKFNETGIALGFFLFFGLNFLLGLVTYKGPLGNYFDIMNFAFFGFIFMVLYVIGNIAISIIVNQKNIKKLIIDLLICCLPILGTYLFWLWLGTLNWKIGG